MTATIVDWNAIWKIALAALVVGVGLTSLFVAGVHSSGRLARARRQGESGAVLVNSVVVGLVGLVCAGAVVLGVIAMTHK